MFSAASISPLRSAATIASALLKMRITTPASGCLPRQKFGFTSKRANWPFLNSESVYGPDPTPSWPSYFLISFLSYFS